MTDLINKKTYLPKNRVLFQFFTIMLENLMAFLYITWYIEVLLTTTFVVNP